MSGPPFERYPVSSAHIRAKGDNVGKSGKPLLAVKNAMDGPRQRAADTVDGELDGKIAGPTDPVQSDAIKTAAGARFCGNAIDLYANYVDLFNRAIDGLNERWKAAVEHDFGVPMSGKSAKEHDADVDDARGVMAQQLRKEYRKAEKALDDGAENVAKGHNTGPEEGSPLLTYYTATTGLTLALGNMFGGGPLTLKDIERRYQVGDDPGGVIWWEPTWPLSMWTEPQSVTATEAEMLADLGALALKDMKDIHDDAFQTANERFTNEDLNDNHNDAFRHAYWNALMTRRFGEDWARNYANAHEGRPGNQQVREAMDLYNNEVGRRIAANHPDAEAEELADLVEQAVRNGETVVVGPDLHLTWSNTVQEGGKTGDADNAPVGPPDGNPENDPDVEADPDSHNDAGTGS